MEAINERLQTEAEESRRDSLIAHLSKEDNIRKLLKENDVITADIYGDYKIDHFIGEKYIFIKITTNYDERYYDFALYTPDDQCPIFYRGGKIKW